MTMPPNGKQTSITLPRKPTVKQIAAAMKVMGLPAEQVFAVYRAMIDAAEREKSKK